MTDLEDPLSVLARVVQQRRVGLVAIARREGLGDEDAVDCVHDAFCIFLQMAVREEIPVDPAEHEPLLAGIVANTAKNKRRRHHVARPHDAIEDADLGHESPSTETLVAHVEECVRLRSCVDRLCRTQRSVVMMRLLEERPGEDVAAALGVTRGYVDVLLHRAKASLRVCMREE